MTPALSTTAWVLHDLGLAANFGGALFGKIGLHPAVREVSDRYERGRVVESAWKGWNMLNLVALGTAAVTWFTGRAMLSGGEIDRSTHGLVIAKDALMATTVLTGVGAFVNGMVISRQGIGPVPLEHGGMPSADAPRAAKVAHRVTDTLGWVNLVGAAAVLGITAALAMKSSQSHRFAFVSRFLP